MRVVITGASGYMGSAFAERLASEGHHVVATSHRGEVRVEGVDMVRCDIRDPEQVRRAVKGADTVVHCAALVGPYHRTADLEKTNVMGTRNVVRAALEEGTGHLVHVSSTCVMDEYIDHDGTDESHPYPEVPRDDYTGTKIAAERLVLDHTDGPAVTVLRPGWVWGPGAPGMQGLLWTLDRGLFVMPGRGDNVLHLTYIDNLASVATRVVGRQTPGTFIITDGARTDLATFTGCLLRHLGRGPRVGSVPFGIAYALSSLIEPFGVALGTGLPNRLQLSNLGRSHRFDTTRAREVLGYRPTVDLEEGSARTVGWYMGVRR